VQRALDRLTIQESLVGKDVQYHYVLELPTLWILKYFKSPVIEGRDGYIVALLDKHWRRLGRHRKGRCSPNSCRASTSTGPGV